MLKQDFRRSTVKRYYRTNHQITAQEVRALSDEGKQIGVISLSEALEIAGNEEKDLVEIAPDAKPPVVKIIDFKKFKYLEDKKEKEARKHTKQTELKEVRFSPFIGDHDLNTAIEKVKRFLSEGNLVKISVIFTGRQMAHQEFGPKMFEKIMESLNSIAEVERDPRFEGKRFVGHIRPTKEAQKLRDQEKNKNQEEQKQNEQSEN